MSYVLLSYVGEQLSKMTLFGICTAVVSTLLNFVRMFIRANEENRKQLELEKKKVQKEAENEKMKTSAPQKEAGHEKINRAPKKEPENEKMKTSAPKKVAEFFTETPIKNNNIN